MLSIYGGVMQILQKPSGMHAIGSSIYEVIDETRTETFSDDPTVKRKLVIELFYPAKENVHARYVVYAEDIMQEWVLGLYQSGFPVHDIVELQKQLTHTIKDAQIKKEHKPYPVILFSHGYAGLRSSYTSYYEELASHGYIVVAISHTYFSKVTKFPDGTLIPAHYANAGQQHMETEEKSCAQQTIWLDDVKAVLSYLETIHQDSSHPFFQAFDFQNCGMIGHSFGGSTAMQMCRHDARIKAAINLDGALYGAQPTDPIHKPIMAILCKNSFDACDNNEWHNQFHASTQQRYCQFIPMLIEQSEQASLKTIAGARHMAFTDWPLIKELPLYKENAHLLNIEGITGAIDGAAFMHDTKQLIVSFFDDALNIDGNTMQKCDEVVKAVG
jgi:dienelactone hydrolase